MSEIAIETKDGRVNFRPGESIAGAAGWKLDRPPKAVELRLFWHTAGKGTTDTGLASVVTFEQPTMEEARPFLFIAPAAPVSFSGRLISVIWSLELVVQPGEDCARLKLVISPTGEEMVPPAGIKKGPGLDFRIDFPTGGRA